MEKQHNLLLHITFSLWGKHIHLYFALFLLCLSLLNLMDLGHDERPRVTRQPLTMHNRFGGLHFIYCFNTQVSIHVTM